MKKCVDSGKALLLLVAFASISTYALSVVPKNPNNHHNNNHPHHQKRNVSKNINATATETKTHQWNGLDYQYEGSLWGNLDNTSYWSDSEEGDWNFYSDENYDDDYYNTHPIVTIGDTKDATTKSFLKVEEPSVEKRPADNSDTVRVVVSTPPTPPQPLKPKESKKLSEKKEPELNWDETSGDSDDGLGGDDKPKENLENLPTDNDLDSDKYFNPDRFNDKIKLHKIEDQFLQRWTVNYQDTDLPCIMLKGNIKLIVPLNPSEFNKDFVEIDVPNNADASGTCVSLYDDYQEITLKWKVTVPNSKSLTYLNIVSFGFATNWTSEYSQLNIPNDKYALVSVTAAYFKGEIGVPGDDDGIFSYTVEDLVEFLTPKNQSMSCYQDKQLLLGNMQLTLSNLQFEAFRANDETLTVGDFSTSVLCSLDDVFRFDAIMTFIIWFWIGALIVVLAIFLVLLSIGFYRKRHAGEKDFNYKILNA